MPILNTQDEINKTVLQLVSFVVIIWPVALWGDSQGIRVSSTKEFIIISVQ